jgi:hypothetical protein
MPVDAMPDDEFEYLMTLTADERAKYLAGKREAAKPAAAKPPQSAPAGGNAQQGTQQAARRPFNMQSYSGANPVQQGFIDQFGPTAQARHLGGMINDVQGAFRAENSSRVAQARDQQEMAHEAQMESMRQEALLQRLAMEQKEREKDRILQRQLQTGVTRKRLVNGRWEYV